MPRKLEPHPLVVGLAEKLGTAGMKTAIKRATTAAGRPGAIGPLGGAAARAVNPQVRPPRFLAPFELADFGAAPASGNRFRSFAGYLGGSVADPLGSSTFRWQLLFIDTNLHSWLIVRTTDILYFDRVQDDTAAGGLRDYVWVGEDALIGRGDPANSAAAVVRSGAFSRAGDLATSLRGDTNTRRSGLMVDSMTPVCCGRYSQ